MRARAALRCLAFRVELGAADAALGELRRQIRYKGTWAAREGVLLDPFYPSSKTCSGCGALNAALRLQKHWQCPACAARHDRDVNATKNLRAEGLRVLGMRGSSPATGERPESDARGVACAAQAAPAATVVSLQPSPHGEPRTGSTARTGRDTASTVSNAAQTCQGRINGGVRSDTRKKRSPGAAPGLRDCGERVTLSSPCVCGSDPD